MNNIHEAKIIFFLLALFTLSSCGEGGIDGTGQDAPIYLEGTAAVGAPIVNSEVVVKGKNGAKLITKTNDQGNYKIDVTSLTAPYILKTSTEQGNILFSIGFETGIVNIHPISDLVLRNYFEVLDLNLENQFSSVTPILNPPPKEDIVKISNTLIKLFSTAYSEFSITSNFDFFTSRFLADQTAFDALLDHLNVTFAENKVDVELVNRNTGIPSKIITGFDLSEDLAARDEQNPTQPKNVLSQAANNKKIVVTWGFSDDNIGISGYKIYQNGSLLSTTSTTVFEHFGLNTSTEYCYVVEAFDPSGNVSLPSNQVCSTTLDQADLNPPSIVSNMNAKATSSSKIKLTWDDSAEPDVLAYQVFRKTNGDFNKISTVTKNEFQDNNLASGAEYCYLIKAFDAAGNVSEESQASCAKTHVLEIEPNNEFDSANDVTEGDFVLGSFLESGDVDFYEINVTNVGELRITMVSIGVASTLAVYDENFFNISNSGGAAGASIHTLKKDVEVGRYFIEAQYKSSFNAQNTYSFKILID